MKKYCQNSFLILLCLTIYACSPSFEHIIGADSLPFVNEIGGKEIGNGLSPQNITLAVETKAELLRALRIAKSGDVVFVKNHARIDLSGHEHLKIPEGVILASTRSKKQTGALLFSNTLKTFPLFITGGENIRITGLRLQGPDSLRRTEQMTKLRKKSKKDYYSIPNSRGIQVMHANVEIDNCEIYGWSHAGIYAKGQVNNIHIHHNDIHHNQRYGLGYGVCLDGASVLIEANHFDWNRHAVAGTGIVGTAYEARYNIVGKNANGHAFDMHGGADRKDKTSIAGTKINIHHNTFMLKEYEAVLIRGIPEEGAIVYNNDFVHLDSLKAVRQVNKKGKLSIHKNRYDKQ